MLGALVLVLQDPPRTTEPARGRPDLAAACEIQADPDCAARGTPLLSGLEEALVRTFEPGDRVIVATEHEGADREQLEVFPARPSRSCTTVSASCASSQARFA